MSCGAGLATQVSLTPKTLLTKAPILSDTHTPGLSFLTCEMEELGSLAPGPTCGAWKGASRRGRLFAGCLP